MTTSSQRPVNETAWAARIEPPSQRTWPAHEVMGFQNWQLRFSGGFSHRANSVAAFSFTGANVEAAIDEVERQYRARGLKPMFQVTAVAPPNLAEVLTRRGYRPTTPSLVCVGVAQEVRTCCASYQAGEITHAANADLDALVVEGSHSEDDGRKRLATLARITVPLVRVTVYIDGKGVACGVAAAADGLAGINLMRTHPAFRRRGFARRVLGDIADWSIGHGIDTLALTVERDNAPARALYEAVRFAVAYDYLYYVLD